MKTTSIALVLTTLALVGVSTRGGAQQRPDAPYDELFFEGGSVELPFERAGALILVDDVWVNGEGPFRFMLDTGAQGGGRVDVSLAKKLGLEPSGVVEGGDGTDRPSRTLTTYELDSLQLGPLRAEGVRVAARDYNEHARGVRGHIDGILGVDLFDDVLFTIDYPRSVLRLEEGELPEPDGGEVLALVPDVAVPGIEVLLGGKRRLAYIDSGAMGPLSVPEALAGELGFKGEPRVVGQGRTVLGPFDLRQATLDGELRIGRHITFEPELILAGPLKQLVLGSEVLVDYALTLDRAHQRVRFLRAGFAAGEAAPHRTYLDQRETSTPLEIELGRPVVEVFIDGEGPFRLILDTGAQVTVLNRDLVEELGIASEGDSTVWAPGSEQRMSVQVHTLSEVVIGEAVFEALPARSWDDARMQRSLGKVRGVLGYPTFRDLLATLDPAAGELRLSHGALGESDGSVAYSQDNDELPTFEIELGGTALEAHFDTGSPGLLTVPGRLENELVLSTKPRVIGRGRTVTGSFEIRGATLAGDAHIAGAQLVKPQVAFSNAMQIANIGSRFLDARVFTLDQNHRRLRFLEAVAGDE